MAYNNRTSGFKFKTREISDRRLVLTKNEMKTLKYAENDESFAGYLPSPASSPSILPALCSDDHMWYYYSYSNTDDPTTGKFKLIGSADSGSTAGEHAQFFTGYDDDKSSKVSSANAGDIYYATDSGKNYMMTGEGESKAWQEITDLKEGKVAYDSDNSRLVVYNGSAWTPVGQGVDEETSTGSITNPEVNKIYYTSDDGKFKVYKNGSWYDMSPTWTGTQTEYDSLSYKDPDVTYYILAS